MLALVCGVAVSAIYGIQPVLEAAGNDLGLTGGTLGWLVAAGQIGYLAGLLLLVPLGDLADRRRLIAVHLLLIAVGTATVALAPVTAVAIAGLAVAGLFAVVVQIAVAYAAAASPPGERGRNIGVVTSGVVIGILGVRIAAGALTELGSWRTIYVVLTVLCLILAAAVWRLLDADQERPRARYRELLTALGRLVTRDRLVRGRSLVAFFTFASFGTLWSGLALPLGAAPWNLGTTAIGLFGLAGLMGALGASRAGRWADRGHATTVTAWALALLAASWFLVAQTHPLVLIVGVVVLDFAVQAVHVSNQHLLTGAHPDKSSGVIGAHMAFYSLGSALGAVTTTWAYSAAGWPASCVLGAGYALAGLVVAWRTRGAARVEVRALERSAS